MEQTFELVIDEATRLAWGIPFDDPSEHGVPVQAGFDEQAWAARLLAGYEAELSAGDDDSVSGTGAAAPLRFPFFHLFLNPCFRVDEADFDAILGRIEAAGIAYRSSVHGPVDSRIDTQHGGRIVYWNEPDGHYWEMLTQSYARKP